MLHFTARGESLSVGTEGKVSHVVASPGYLVCKKQGSKSMVSSHGAGELFFFPGHPFKINQSASFSPRAAQEEATSFLTDTRTMSLQKLYL